MMALVGRLASADTFSVTAKIPAPMPSGAPEILTPKDGSAITTPNTVVSGTCPIITPAIIVAIFDNTTSLVGSVQCADDGTFRVAVPISYGTNRLTATVITITDDTGETSTPVIVTRPAPPKPPKTGSKPPVTYSGGNGLSQLSTSTSPIHIAVKNRFVLLGADGSAVWAGSISGGTPPYTVQMIWGDGDTESHTVTDYTMHAFSHHYKVLHAYDIVTVVMDTMRDTATIHTAAATLSLQLGAPLKFDSSIQSVPPILAFVQDYMWEIYIGSIATLTFLWYLEHGRHLHSSIPGIGRMTHRH